MQTWLRPIVATAILTAMLGLGGWNLLKASTNSSDITGLKSMYKDVILFEEKIKEHEQKILNAGTEYRILLSMLSRIEKGINEIRTQQETFNIRLGKMNIAQAVVNQKLIDHIIIDDQRESKIENRINRLLHRQQKGER